MEYWYARSNLFSRKLQLLFQHLHKIVRASLKGFGIFSEISNLSERWIFFLTWLPNSGANDILKRKKRLFTVLFALRYPLMSSVGRFLQSKHAFNGHVKRWRFWYNFCVFAHILQSYFQCHGLMNPIICPIFSY